MFTVKFVGWYIQVRITKIFKLASLMCIFLSTLTYADLADEIEEEPAVTQQVTSKKNNNVNNNNFEKKNDKNIETSAGKNIERTIPEDLKPNANKLKKQQSIANKEQAQKNIPIPSENIFPARKNGNQGNSLKLSPDNEEESLPVYFEGETLSGFRSEGVLELHSKVKISQGDFNMDADHAKVYFNQETDEVKKVIAQGHVKMKQIDPKTKSKINADSQQIEFDALKQQVVLTGKAKLKKGEDIIKGETIHYDMLTGWLQANKVKGVVQPEEKDKVE